MERNSYITLYNKEAGTESYQIERSNQSVMSAMSLADGVDSRYPLHKILSLLCLPAWRSYSPLTLNIEPDTVARCMSQVNSNILD